MKTFLKIQFLSLVLVLCAPLVAFAGYDDGAAAVQSGDYQTAYREFKKAAQDGDAESQNCLAYMHYMGLGAEKDLVEAHRWWHRAASSGHAEANKNMTVVLKQMTIVQRALVSAP